jgi:hypothetical protein
MTAVSCVVVGLAFAAAVGLLVFAGFAIGWLLPARLGRRRGRSRPGGN